MSYTKVITALASNFVLDSLLEIVGGKLQLAKKYADPTNLAYGLVPTSSDVGAVNLDKVTDESLATFGYLPSGSPAWVKIDLGSIVVLRLIKLWHLVGGTSRSYHDVIVQISEDDVTYTTLFNNDTDDSAGEGVGTDAEYIENETGLSVSCGTNGLTARYIRIWSNGSSADTISHFAEIEAYQYTYSPLNPKAKTSGYWRTNTLNIATPFASIITEAGNDKVKFQVLLDGTPYFWDGSQWIVATESYDYANTTADLNTNLGTLFDTPDPKNLQFNVYFHSDTGDTTPDLTSFTFKYDLDEGSTGTDKPATRKVFGFLYDVEGNPVEDTAIIVSINPPKGTKVDNALVVPMSITVETDNDGYFEFEAIPTASMDPNTVLYMITIPSLGLRKNISIPTGSTPLNIGTLI